MTVLVGLVDVASRGRIRLRSADPRHRPAIDPGYLSDERDGRALAAGLKMAREFVTARPMAEICSSELAPGAHVRSDAELLEYVRSSVVTLYHPVGTCSMGGESRWNSVVDPELRVRGVTGLRVVDASVMPFVPRGNTNAPTIAIAERAADLIAGRAPLAAVDPADPVDAMVIARQLSQQPGRDLRRRRPVTDHVGDEARAQPEQDAPVDQLLPAVLVGHPEQLDDDVEDGPGGQGQEDHAHGVAGELPSHRGAHERGTAADQPHEQRGTPRRAGRPRRPAGPRCRTPRSRCAARTR